MFEHNKKTIRLTQFRFWHNIYLAEDLRPADGVGGRLSWRCRTDNGLAGDRLVQQRIRDDAHFHGDVVVVVVGINTIFGYSVSRNSLVSFREHVNFGKLSKMSALCVLSWLLKRLCVCVCQVCLWVRVARERDGLGMIVEVLEFCFYSPFADAATRSAYALDEPTPTRRWFPPLPHTCCMHATAHRAHAFTHARTATATTAATTTTHACCTRACMWNSR